MVPLFVGWGSGSFSLYLYQVHLEMLSQETCAREINEFVDETMICAGDVQNGGRDTCQVCLCVFMCLFVRMSAHGNNLQTGGRDTCYLRLSCLYSTPGFQLISNIYVMKIDNTVYNIKLNLSLEIARIITLQQKKDIHLQKVRRIILSFLDIPHF